MLSEELVSATIRLLAILCQADGVDERERQVVRAYLTTLLTLEKAEQYIREFDHLVDHASFEVGPEGFLDLKSSAQLVKFCDQLNQGLTANQKVRLVVVMFTLVNADGSITDLERDLVYAAAEVFNISFHELGLIERFVFLERPSQANNKAFLVLTDQPTAGTERGLEPVLWPGLQGLMVIMRLEAVNLWLVKYLGQEHYLLDGAPLVYNQPTEFGKGSSIRGGLMEPLYFTEVISLFSPHDQERVVTFVAEKISYQFGNGQQALHMFDLYERSGRLVGIMGPSGSGKSTLLEVLVGLRAPATGQVRLNGYDIHKRGKSIEGLIGYVPQEDMLIEELSAYDNLFYAAKLSFAKLDLVALHDLVLKTLAELELDHIKDQQVGSVHDRLISGGERKRLNMGLELLRRPPVLFLDEPTSGLSSRDSLSLIDLLKEQTLQGKLIFVVIHQPSSDIYKLFDHLLILDKGGYPIYYGDPVAAVVYFKQCIHQVGADVSVCPVCANINPEQVFDIIEGRTLNHVGHFTTERRIAPGTWYKYFIERLKKPNPVEDVRKRYRMPHRKPNLVSQWLTFTVRDLQSKWANKQYVLVNLLTAPLLALVLGFINLNADRDATALTAGAGGYAYGYNDNIPAYLFMCTVVAIFLGMTLSAAEIINDRKLLRRERFLHLSRLSYLLSKVVVTFGILAIQMAVFTLIANSILQLPDVNLTFWIVLFALACCSALTSLILSSAFRTTVTVYILIPILIIPQLLLGGVVIPYSRINHSLTDGNRVPLIAEWIPARWGFEALMVEVYKRSPYIGQRYFYQQRIATAELYHTLIVPQLLDFAKAQLEKPGQQAAQQRQTCLYHLEVLGREIPALAYRPLAQLKERQDQPVHVADWAPVVQHLVFVQQYFKAIQQQEQRSYQRFVQQLTATNAERERVRRLAETSHNLAVEKVLRNNQATPQLVWTGERLEPTVYSIFWRPLPRHLLDFRAQYFAPVKYLSGVYLRTGLFNLLVLWVFCLVLFGVLYFDLLSFTLRGFKRER